MIEEIYKKKILKNEVKLKYDMDCVKEIKKSLKERGKKRKNKVIFLV